MNKRLALGLVIIGLVPLWWKHQIDEVALINLIILSVGWVVYLMIDKKTIKILLAIFLMMMSVFFLLNNDGIISSGKIEVSRSYWVDNYNQNELTKFQQMALFLPFRLRPVIWGNWWQVVEMPLRGMSGLSGELLWPVIGPGLWFLAIFSLYDQKEIEVGIAIFGIVMMGWLGRNQNTSLIGIYLLPAMVVMALPAMKKVDLKILVGLIIIGLPFIF